MPILNWETGKSGIHHRSAIVLGRCTNPRRSTRDQVLPTEVPFHIRSWWFGFGQYPPSFFGSRWNRSTR